MPEPGEGAKPKDIAPIHVRLNEPFSVPRPVFRPYRVTHNFADQELARLDLDIESVGRGALTFDGVIRPHLQGPMPVHLPAGTPPYELRINPDTGELEVIKLPINPSVMIGNLRGQGSNYKTEVNYDGNLYTGINYSVAQGPDSEFAPYLLTQSLWTDSNGQRKGPLYLPYDVDFSKLQFLVGKKS